MEKDAWVERPFPCSAIQRITDDVGTHPYVLFEEDNFSEVTLVSSNYKMLSVTFNTETT